MLPKRQEPKKNLRPIFKRLGRKLENRNNCCWNCFETGHLRFQCSLPKIQICSFCRRKGVKTTECSCIESRLHFAVSEHEEVDKKEQKIENIKITEYGPFQENVTVPVNIDGSKVKYVPKENLVVFVANDHNMIEEEEDRDFIEIHPEDDCLDQL